MNLEHINALQFKRRHHQLQGMQCWSQRACWVTVLQVCADKGLGELLRATVTVGLTFSEVVR